jgi:hypothetical protein
MVGVPHHVDITSADTLLVVYQTISTRVLLSQNIGDKGVHTGCRKEDSGVIFGNQRGTRNLGVLMGNKKIYKFLA